MAYASVSHLGLPELTSVRRFREAGKKGMKWHQHLSLLKARAEKLDKKFPGQGFGSTANKLSSLSSKSDKEVSGALSDLANKHFDTTWAIAHRHFKDRSDPSTRSRSPVSTAHYGLGANLFSLHFDVDRGRDPSDVPLKIRKTVA